MKPLTGKQWKKKAAADAKHDIEYHGKELAEDTERMKQAVAFMADLRAAVKGPPKP